MEKNIELYEDKIKAKIHTIRGLRVMLDNDLAELYGVQTKGLNRAVKRNIERFPKSFMFQLTEVEFDSLRSQIATLEKFTILRCQNGTSSSKYNSLKSQNEISGLMYGGRRYFPYAFTQEGVAMLSGILRTQTAVKISIKVIEAFVSMRRFILYNAQIFMRLDNVEKKQLEYQINTDRNFDKVFNAIESKQITPKQGIFFEGQIFDAHKFVSNLIRSANKSIILIDNYIDDSVLTLFNKIKKNINITIYTKNISQELILDLKKYNLQYPKIEIKEFKHSHDRFMIIDNKEVYHIGASLKDLGKKWFAFSKFDKMVFEIMQRLNQ